MNLAQGKKMLVLTQQELKEYLHYDSETGVFTQIKARPKVRVGDIAGHINQVGYVLISIKNVRHFAHRLAWLYMTGFMPKDMIDHVNGNKTDNRFCNLREANDTQNSQNQVRVSKQNSTGYLGVTWNKREKKYMAAIRVNTKPIHLGYFDDPQKAHEAYLVAKRKYHEFCTI